MCEHAQPCLTICDHSDCRQPAPLSKGFSRQGSWVTISSPQGIFPTQRLNLHLPQWQVDFFFFFFLPLESPGKPILYILMWDRGAWWAAVYGVAQSRTWLKRLSSSSSSIVYVSVPISQSTPSSLPSLGVHILVLSVCVSISTLQTKTTYIKHGVMESNPKESIGGIIFPVPAPLSPESLLLAV